MQKRTDLNYKLNYAWLNLSCLALVLLNHSAILAHKADELIVIDENNGEVLIIDEAHNRARRQIKREPIICEKPELESEIDTSIKQSRGGECGMGAGCEAGLACNSRFICE